MEARFMKRIIGTLILTVTVVLGISVCFSFAQIIFSTGFEDVQNWTQARPPKNATGYGWPSSWSGYNNGNPVYPPPRKTDGTFLFDMFRVGATVFDSNVTPAFEIKDGIGRDGGRGLVYNVEVSGSYGVWTGGNPVGVWLGNTGCQDVYVRFYLRYPPEWKWTDDNNPISNRGAQQKILRLSRYNGTLNDGGNPQVYGPSSGGKNDPVWIPDWYQYISVTPSYSKFMNSERYSPAYTANDPISDFLSVNPAFYPSGSDLLWPTDSKWHCYEFRAKMNSAPGVADGISEIWLDGVLVWSKSNIAWVNAGGSIQQGWNNVSILDNVTMPAYPLTSQVAYPLYLDNIVISTTYSGPPPKPVNVSAQAISTTTARVSWTAGSNGATYAVNGYRIYYGTSSTSLTSSVTAGNVTSYDITGLQAGQTYYFAVTAINKAAYDTNENESKKSNVVYPGSSTPIIFGDLNEDGQVTAEDAQLVLDIKCGKVAVTANYLVRGDVAPIVNGISQPDGKVDTNDAIAILAKISGRVNF